MRDNTHAPMEMKHITPDVLMRLSIAFTSGSKFSQSGKGFGIDRQNQQS